MSSVFKIEIAILSNVIMDDCLQFDFKYIYSIIDNKQKHTSFSGIGQSAIVVMNCIIQFTNSTFILYGFNY